MKFIRQRNEPPPLTKEQAKTVCEYEYSYNEGLPIYVKQVRDCTERWTGEKVTPHIAEATEFCENSRYRTQKQIDECIRTYGKRRIKR